MKRDKFAGPLSEAAQAGLRAIVERFVHPTPAEFAQVLRLAREQHFAPKALVEEAGRPCNRVHLVLTGVARHSLVQGGRVHTVGFSWPGSLLTDTASFLGRQPGLLNLVSVSRMHTVSFSHEQIQALYAAAPVWEQFGRLLAEAHLLHVSQRAVSLQINSAAARYEELMQTHPSLFNLVPLNQLASYLGMAKETLSRLRRRRVPN